LVCSRSVPSFLLTSLAGIISAFISEPVFGLAQIWLSDALLTELHP
jgi:hypothetical protein